MPAGVAVLERLGLRAAVGGRPLASVRYHGFGLTAEAASRRARTGPCPSRSAQRRLRAGPDVAGGGARDAGRARVRGGAGRGRRDRRRPRGRPARRRRAPAGRPGRRRRRPRFARAPLARARSPRRAANRRVGVRTHYRLAAGRSEPSRLEIFVGPRLRAVRGAAARRRAAARRARRSRRASVRARASRWSAGSASSRCCATGWTARRR